MRRLCIALLVSAPALASDLIGPVACRVCHAEAYRIWSGSAHARAAQALGAENRKTPLCLQCHSRDEQRSGQSEVAGVSCETCHGGGRYYMVAPVMKDKELARLFGLVDPTPQSCMVCHGGESPSLKPFDVKEATARIDHWTADREARKPKNALLDRGAPVPRSVVGVPSPSGYGTFAILSRAPDMLAAWLKARP